MYNPYSTLNLAGLLKEGETEDMSIVEKLRDIARPEAERLMRKHKIVDECGHLTTVGKEIIWDKLLEQHKDKIVANLKTLEEKEKKKGKK